VEFSRELRAEVLSGDITVTFRLWRTGLRRDRDSSVS